MRVRGSATYAAARRTRQRDVLRLEPPGSAAVDRHRARLISTGRPSTGSGSIGRCAGRRPNAALQAAFLAGLELKTFCVRVRRSTDRRSLGSRVSLRVEFSDSGRNDANVSSDLEDQVVEIRRRHGAQDESSVEDVEWPIADGAALQMWVGESEAEVGANDYRFDTGGPLLWP